MKQIPTIVKRGKITYVLYPEKVVIGVGLNQWISYNQYDNWNRQGITQFRKTIMASKDTEHTTPSEALSIANQCGIIGASTYRPKELD